MQLRCCLLPARSASLARVLRVARYAAGARSAGGRRDTKRSNSKFDGTRDGRVASLTLRSALLDCWQTPGWRLWPSAESARLRARVYARV